MKNQITDFRHVLIVSMLYASVQWENDLKNVTLNRN